jgi:GTPase Era involved in 16S rRNA processing
VIVSEIAGTTRDAIDVRIELPDGRRVTAIDTAGVRRKKSFQDQIEWYAFDRAQRAIQRADVVQPDLFKGAYERFLMNRLREELPYDEVPIRVLFRSRKRAELAALKAGKTKRSEMRQGRFLQVDPESQQIGEGAGVFEDLFRDLPDDPAAYFDDDEIAADGFEGREEED